MGSARYPDNLLKSFASPYVFPQVSAELTGCQAFAPVSVPYRPTKSNTPKVYVALKSKSPSAMGFSKLFRTFECLNQYQTSSTTRTKLRIAFCPLATCLTNCSKVHRNRLLYRNRPTATYQLQRKHFSLGYGVESPNTCKGLSTFTARDGDASLVWDRR